MPDRLTASEPRQTDLAPTQPQEEQPQQAEQAEQPVNQEEKLLIEEKL